MFFISLFCFTPFEENESKRKMVVEKHVTRQSLTQSPADQKALQRILVTRLGTLHWIPMRTSFFFFKYTRQNVS